MSKSKSFTLLEWLGLATVAIVLGFATYALTPEPVDMEMLKQQLELDRHVLEHHTTDAIGELENSTLDWVFNQTEK